MFAQYSMSPNIPSCPPMEPSYSTSSEDSVQSSMPFYYANYPPTSDFELQSQPMPSPSYAPSFTSSSASSSSSSSSFGASSSFNSPSFSSCDFTPPLVYPAQQLPANNATYFAPMQAHCPWGVDPAAVAAAASAGVGTGAMTPMDGIMIPDMDNEVDMDWELEMEMEQQYAIDSKSMTATTSPLPMSMPAPIPMSLPAELQQDLSHTTSNAGKPFSCTDCGRAFTRPADLKRHQSSVHNPVFQDCPVEECLRKDSNGFPRRDHLIEHLRSYHHWDVPKRRAVRRGVKTT